MCSNWQMGCTCKALWPLTVPKNTHSPTHSLTHTHSHTNGHLLPLVPLAARSIGDNLGFSVLSKDTLDMYAARGGKRTTPGDVRKSFNRTLILHFGFPHIHQAQPPAVWRSLQHWHGPSSVVLTTRENKKKPPYSSQVVACRSVCPWGIWSDPCCMPQWW